MRPGPSNFSYIQRSCVKKKQRQETFNEALHVEVWPGQTNNFDPLTSVVEVKPGPSNYINALPLVEEV